MSVLGLQLMEKRETKQSYYVKKKKKKCNCFPSILLQVPKI